MEQKTYYKLDENKNPVACSFEKWREVFERNRVVKVETVNNREISTVFLGMNHKTACELSKSTP